jgi:hypothetical protein
MRPVDRDQQLDVLLRLLQREAPPRSPVEAQFPVAPMLANQACSVADPNFQDHAVLETMSVSGSSCIGQFW